MEDALLDAGGDEGTAGKAGTDGVEGLLGLGSGGELLAADCHELLEEACLGGAVAVKEVPEALAVKVADGGGGALAVDFARVDEVSHNLAGRAAEDLEDVPL